MSIADSVIVKFGVVGGGSALVKMELDAMMNVDAAGNVKSSFSPGDEIFFLLHHESSVRAEKILATHGMVVYQGMVSRDRTEQLSFATVADTHELGYIPAGAIAAKWYGNEGSGLKKSAQRNVIISGGSMPALADVSYQASMRLYKLLTPSVELGADETWPINIVAYMEAV